jgi:hypothetical protein
MVQYSEHEHVATPLRVPAQIARQIGLFEGQLVVQFVV